LYFLPEPQGQGSLRPTFGPSRFTVCTSSVPPCASRGACALAKADGVAAALARKAESLKVSGRALVLEIPSAGARVLPA